MAAGIRFVCNSGGETITSWDEGEPYYLDKRGRKKYAYHPDPKRDQCIGIDSPQPVLVLWRELYGRFPIPNRPMPEMFLHLDPRHLRPGRPELPVLQKGQIRARPPFLGSILAFRLAFGLQCGEYPSGAARPRAASRCAKERNRPHPPAGRLLPHRRNVASMRLRPFPARASALLRESRLQQSHMLLLPSLSANPIDRARGNAAHPSCRCLSKRTADCVTGLLNQITPHGFEKTPTVAVPW
jgi:hypothetical protein